MEDPVHTVLVVCGGEDVRDDEFSTTGDNDGIVTEISVLEQNASIFFVNANSILDGGALSCSVYKCGIPGEKLV